MEEQNCQHFWNDDGLDFYKCSQCGELATLDEIIKIQGEHMKTCYDCNFHKRMSSPRKGVKIPNGTGKCTKQGGHCDPDVVKGKIGEGKVYRKKALA